MKKANHSMLQGPLFSNIVSYTIPIILTSVLQLLFNAADLVIVGRFRGSIAVAAVSATSSLTMLIINLFMGMSVGVGVAVAHALGGKQEEITHRAVHTAIPVALIGGVLVTIIGVLCSESLLVLMGTPKKVLPLSALYMRIYFAGITFTMLYNFCASILRAAGDTKGPLIYLSIGGVINVVLNVFFVTAFDMSVDGVALATIISQAIAAVLSLIALHKRQDACHLDFKRLRIYGPQLAKIIRIGLPAGIQSSLFSISNVIIQSSVNSFGDIFMSGNGAAASIEGFIYVTFNAFQQTTVNFIGQNVGARQYKRIRMIFCICLVSAMAVTMVIGTCAYIFGETLLAIYITDSQKAIEYGMIRLAYIALPYFLCAVMEITTGALRGIGASLIPMLLSVLGVCGIRVLWIYTIFQIPAYHTPQCLYTSYPISWTITFLFQLLAFFLVYRKHKKAYSPLEA